MCTRYFLSDSSPKLKSIIEEVKASPLTHRFMIRGNTIMTEGEIRPTDTVPVLAPDPEGRRKVFPMSWGYRNPYNGGKLLLNARTETAHEKPTFKEDWEMHRCIIPASYYFEWQHMKRADGKIETGDRFTIQPKDEDVTWLCGLYHIEDNFPTFVVLTREPREEIAFIHNRMPLILPSSLIDEWIRPGTLRDDILEEALIDMVAEKG